MTNGEHDKRLLDLRGEVSPHPRVHYLQHEFRVAEELHGLKVTLRFHKERRCQLFLSVFGPAGYRGTRMNPAAVGEIELELRFGTDFASPGALPGPIEAGEWRVQIDVESTDETTPYSLTVGAHTEDPTAHTTPKPATQNGRAGQGWYRGELHAHTHHSDGKPTPTQLAAAARQYQLDFLALTDHFTPAGWPEIQALADEKLAVIRSLELTGHRGHANLHGLQEWVDVFVDDPDEPWNVNDVARAVRSQGGLFCVNHAFSNHLGWRYHEFDWSLCDAYEIYHQLEGPNNAAQLTFWDGLLRAGQRITGVAGTDSHDPHAGRHRLGQAVTVIGADSLTPSGLLAGLKAGRAYVSLGPTLMFEGHAGGDRAGMGGELPCAPVRLQLQLTNLQYPTRLFVLKNGLYHTHQDLPANSAVTELEIHDPDPLPGYYRAEAYALAPQSDSVAGREWQNTLLLSNPIYVRG
ncbi:CehA/McbA family metallohydrolase [Deinococcus peraridilitoris]|uniref:Putative metal-dependent phosphoesterase, PHP family n=1 Tax=Deinococcus peraridilitoris (strain DSM 19664 / LMG 22246 / CIP 109416 / KR-200) TaxID=937777 RepID=K9ZZ89_DEIPD|nr:CehA/McbA family metallohydrolase [Deinococcus peraridilitoris]AFZ66911.1 putative metal-dependent phosphoesterase, PHP family [Deinococcus peraridilitoris DSM 19664]